MRKCSGCDALFEIPARERNKRRWCSESCRAKAWRVSHPDEHAAANARRATAAKAQRLSARPKCGECGDRVKLSDASYCNKPECQKVGKRYRMRQRYALNRDEAVARQRRIRAEMTDEQREAARATRREWSANAGYYESKRAGDQRRRARKLGVTVENFKTRDVFERDGWRCGICAKKVDQFLVWPHPMSPSLDHIVPLSLNGPHSRANTRLAHLQCNVRRGNRAGAEQLALIG